MPRKKRTSDDRVVLQNAIKTLAANIRFSSVDKPIKSIAVVSSIPSEGKTTIAANLGAAIVGSGTSAVLVECDMRRRSMAMELGVHGRHGLYSVLSGRHTLEEAVVPTKNSGLYFLDAEPGIPNPPDLLQSKRFRELIGQLTRAFGYVIFDTPPVSTFVDGAVVASLCDATILVVRQDFTRREEVQDAIGQFKQAGANLIGTVLNYCDAESSSKYYGYYKSKDRGTSLSVSSHDDEASNASDSASNLKPIPEGSRVAASVPQVDAQDSGSVAVIAQGSHAAGATGTGAAAPSGSTPPRRIIPRRRGNSSNAAAADSSPESQADGTMAFLAQAGYAPRSNSADSDADSGTGSQA